MKKKTSWLIFVAIFSAFLLYFFFGNGWLPKANLEIRGFVPQKTGRLVLEWDSGAGLNKYERYHFVLNPVPLQKTGEHQISIQYTGKRNSASLSSVFVCSRILIDGHELSLPDLSAGKELHKLGIGFEFKKEGDQLVVRTRARRHIHIEMRTNNHSGLARIFVNSRGKTHDLYTANIEARKQSLDYWLVGPQGEFSVTMPFPRYAISRLSLKNGDGRWPVQIESVKLAGAGFQKELWAADVKPALLDKIVIEKPNSGLKRYYHPRRFLLQLVFASLSTWLITAVIRALLRGDSLSGIFYKEKRYVFWLFFFSATVFFSFWLLAFWPGVLSVDSLKVWRAARFPDISIDNHPFLNEIYYLFLMQLWDNVAVVSIIQILLTAVLGAWIFYRLHLRGIALLVLFPFYLGYIFSVSIGVYNITLWSDIPFALLIVFWAWTLGEIYHQKKNGRLKLSLEKALALFLLYFALCFIRYNGALYLATLPLMIPLLGLVSIKRLVLGVVICTMLAAAGYYLLKNYPAIKNSYFFAQSHAYIDRLKSDIKVRIERSTTEYFSILNINQTASKWDIWHLFLHDRTAYRFLERAGWNDAYPYKPFRYGVSEQFYDLGMKMYLGSYKTPWVYFSWNPFYILSLFPLTLLLSWWLPRSAIFSAVVMIQVVALLFLLQVLNWRYYYFIYLACFFLPLLIVGELSMLWYRTRMADPLPDAVFRNHAKL